MIPLALSEKSMHVAAIGVRDYIVLTQNCDFIIFRENLFYF
jgi:hypothetical protein